MPAKTLSSRQFNQDSSGAKRAANDGPVFITDRGAPSHVLMSMAEYETQVRQRHNLLSDLRELQPKNQVSI